MDEAQMVESSTAKAAEMALKLSSINKMGNKWNAVREGKWISRSIRSPAILEGKPMGTLPGLV